jgi:hypothetical protein
MPCRLSRQHAKPIYLSHYLRNPVVLIFTLYSIALQYDTRLCLQPLPQLHVLFASQDLWKYLPFLLLSKIVGANATAKCKSQIRTVIIGRKRIKHFELFNLFQPTVDVESPGPNVPKVAPVLAQKQSTIKPSLTQG